VNFHIVKNSKVLVWRAAPYKKLIVLVACSGNAGHSLQNSLEVLHRAGGAPYFLGVKNNGAKIVFLDGLIEIIACNRNAVQVNRGSLHFYNQFRFPSRGYNNIGLYNRQVAYHSCV